MRGAVAVITRDNFVTWEMKALHRAARARGISLVRIDPMRWAFDVQHARFEGISKGLIRQDPSMIGAIGRIDQDALLAGLRVLEVLARVGVPTINGPAAVRNGRDKALAALALSEHGVPQPESRIMSALTVDHLRHVSYPVVVKPLIGGKGALVSKAAGPRELLRLLKENGSPMLVQSFVSGAKRELRLVILDGSVLAAVAKTPPPGEWRANLSLGARAMPVKAEIETADAAVRAARAVGADFAAVDILETAEGPLVIDVNVCPGFQHVEAATGADIAGSVMDSMRRRIMNVQ